MSNNFKESREFISDGTALRLFEFKFKTHKFNSCWILFELEKDQSVLIKIRCLMEFHWRNCLWVKEFSKQLNSQLNLAMLRVNCCSNIRYTLSMLFLKQVWLIHSNFQVLLNYQYYLKDLSTYLILNLH